VHVVGTTMSVIRNWDLSLRGFTGWSVNLELPWRRSPVGYDSRDLILDLTVADDLSSWTFSARTSCTRSLTTSRPRSTSRCSTSPRPVEVLLHCPARAEQPEAAEPGRFRVLADDAPLGQLVVDHSVDQGAVWFVGDEHVEVEPFTEPRPRSEATLRPPTTQRRRAELGGEIRCLRQHRRE